MQKQQIPLKNSLLLLLAAIIWGIAFVAQSVGMKYVGGFTFNAVRSLIGACLLYTSPDFPGNPVLCHSTGSDHRWIPDAHISNQD